VVFQTDYEEIKLQKIGYDVITITSPKNVTKITLQNSSILDPLQSKFLTASVLNCAQTFVYKRVKPKSGNLVDTIKTFCAVENLFKSIFR